MKLFADESVWEITREFVRQLGHDLATVEERGLAGAADETVLAQALAEDRALLSRDLDFSNILLYPPADHFGVIVLRIKPHTTEAVHRIWASVLAYFSQSSIQQILVIIDHNKFRKRR